MYRRYWLVSFWKRGFEGKMLVYGTEKELWAYLNAEFGSYSYSEATEAELLAARLLKLKAYICPEITRF